MLILYLFQGIVVVALCLAQACATAKLDKKKKGGPNPQLVVGGQVYSTGGYNDNHGLTLHSGTPVHNLITKDHGYAASYGHRTPYSPYGQTLGLHGLGLHNQFGGLGHHGSTLGLHGYGNQGLLGGYSGLHGSLGGFGHQSPFGFSQLGLGGLGGIGRHHRFGSHGIHAGGLSGLSGIGTHRGIGGHSGIYSGIGTQET